MLKALSEYYNIFPEVLKGAYKANCMICKHECSADAKAASNLATHLKVCYQLFLN